MPSLAHAGREGKISDRDAETIEGAGRGRRMAQLSAAEQAAAAAIPAAAPPVAREHLPADGSVHLRGADRNTVGGDSQRHHFVSRLQAEEATSRSSAHSPTASNGDGRM